METKTNYDYLIIGGGVAGTSAAETLRAQDKNASIAIVSDEPYRFYSRILLSKPNFFLEKIPFDSVWLKTVVWYEQNQITLLDGRTAAILNPATSEITLDNGQIFTYKKLLLALGSQANKWMVKGSEKPGVCYLRTLDDAKQITTATKSAKRAVLVGSGFTSFEMCEMLRLGGIEVTLVILEPYYWYPTLDEDSGKIIEAALEKSGVKILRNAEVQEVLGSQRTEGVILKDGAKIPCDLVIAGIGVHTQIDWLASTGLRLNRGILANEFLETNLANIWTAGDCAEFKDLILGEQIKLGNWVNAQTQGRIAAANMLGQKKPFRFVSFYTAQGFGITVAFAGDARVLPDRKIVIRHAPETQSYGRLFIKDDELIGATLVNRTQELATLTKIIEMDIKVGAKQKQLADPNFDLKKLLDKPRAKKEKIRIGWFSFSCCEDSTIVFTELMNEHWKEWKDKFDFRHARVLKSKNVLDEMDIAFVEGAIASEEQATKVKEIRAKSKKLVAIGACAVMGMPSGQRNNFTAGQRQEIEFLLARFKAMPKVLKLADVVKVDAVVPGCPMDPNVFLKTVDTLVQELG